MRVRHILFAVPLLASFAGVADAQVKSMPTLAFEDGLRIATEALRIAKSRSQPSAIVVVNRDGRVIVAMRMDGVSFLNLDVAQSKAVTAAALGISTDALEQAIDGGKPSLLAVQGLGPIGGGAPISSDGHVIAGIGVSGGAPADDKAIADAAIAAARR